MTSLLPAEFNTVTLTGQFVNLDGTPVAGYLSFAPSPTVLRAAASKDIIVPVAINATLDGYGAFSIALPATNDPDINPQDWTYTVTEAFGNRRTYSVQILLEAGTTQNIFDLSPIENANGTYYDVGPTGPAGPPALIVSGAPSSAVGGIGDYAIDPAAGILYGPKVPGGTPWGTGVHLAAADVAAHAALTRSHGVQSGSVLVGTTDTQTLSNKTLLSPIFTGTLSAAGASFTGNVTLNGNDLTLDDITGDVASFNQVIVANAPASGTDATNKTYADALGTASNTASTIMRRSSANAVAVSTITGLTTPTQNDAAANKGYVDTQVATKAAIAGDLGGTAATPTVTSGANHGHTSAQITDATSAATASTLAKRDASANATFNEVLVTGQTTAASAVRKDYADALGVSAPTVSTIVRRDSAGRFQAVSPSASADVAIKSYTDAADLADRRLSANAQAANYTLALADESELVYSTGASAQTFTVPPNSTTAFPIGSVIEVLQGGTGALTIAAGAGVTVLAPDGSLVMRARYSRARLIKVATDTWYVQGDTLTAVAAQTDAPLLRVGRVAAQSLTNNLFTTIVFDTKYIDTANIFTTGNSDIVVTRAGYYQVNIQVVEANNPGGRISVALDYALAATPTSWVFAQIGCILPTGGIFNPSVNAAGILYLNAGDRIHMRAYQDSGTAQNTFSTDYSQTSLALQWLRY